MGRGAALMFNRLMAGLFDDPEWSEAEPAPLVHNVIADLLPYRFYDEDEELYDDFEDDE